jgi:HK97 family phage major capsid protein
MKSKRQLEIDMDLLAERIVDLERRGEDSLTRDETQLLAEMRAELRKCQIDMELYQPVGQPLTRPGPQSNRRSNGPFAHIGEQLMAVRNAATPGRELDQRLYQVKAAATGLGETVPSSGGFLVQPEFSDMLLEKSYTTGEIIQRCFKQSLRSNSIKIPSVDESSRATGSRHGGVRAFWIDEAGTKQASAPKFGQIELNLKKLVVLIYSTDELLDDADALGAYIARVAPQEIQFVLESAIINGTGAGMPLGILNSGCLVTASKESGQAANTLVFENITKMWTRMFGPCRKNAVWLINQDCESQLYSMSLAVGTGGVPVYMPAGQASAAPYASLFGRPVIPTEYCPTLGDLGDVLLCDFSQYVLADRGGIQSAMSIHVEFLTDQSVFRFVLRTDGQPWWASALTQYQGTNTQSPFVALESR